MKLRFQVLVLTLLVSGAFQFTAATEIKPGWNEIFPGGETGCAMGTPYSFHVKQGASNRLMVFFNGGGACWSGDSCDVNTEPTNYVPLASLPHNDPKTRDGAFSLENPDNPFSEWSQVYVSYCTGDVHLGDSNATYQKSDGSTIVIQHRGKANSQAAIDWIADNFDRPDRIFVSGGSAGAIAAPYYAAVIADVFPKAEILQFSGGAGGYRDMDLTAALTSWGVFNNLPDWKELKGYTAENLVLDDFYRISASRHPDIRFHQFNTALDAVQVMFRKLLGATTPLPEALATNLSALKKDLPHFSSYVAGGNFHTVLRFNELYSFESQSVRIVDWVRDIATGKRVRDIGCEKSCRVESATSDPSIEFLNSANFKSLGLPFSEAVRVGNLLFLSGQLGNLPGQFKTVEGGVLAETEQTLINIRSTLERYGSTMQDVAKCTLFLADIDDWPKVNEVYARHFSPDYPARSALGTNGLALGAKVEIECIAVVGSAIP